jgi:hypothetical protein
MNDLVTALAKAQSEMTAAVLDGVNPAFKANGKPGRYATLQSIIAAVRPSLAKHGIAYTQRVEMTDRGVGVETILMGHGAEIRGGLVVVPLDKATAQGMGSALTYGKRYSLAAICGISAEEDDDGAAAESSSPGSPRKISTDQLDHLVLAIGAAGMTAEKFCQAYGIALVTDLPADRYESAMRRLSERADKIAANQDAAA